MMHRTLFSAAMAVLILWGDAQVAQADSGMMQSLAGDAIADRSSSRQMGYLLAAMKNTGAWTHASCQKGCSDSHDYCVKHQSKEMDCDVQADACYRWCDEEFDKPPIVASQPSAEQPPKMSLPGAMAPASPKLKMRAPGQVAPKLGPKPLLHRGLKKSP